MSKYEYKTVVVKQGGFFKSPDLEGVLNREAQEGWQLKQVLPNLLGFWDKFLVLLEREVPE